MTRPQDTFTISIFTSLNCRKEAFEKAQYPRWSWASSACVGRFILFCQLTYFVYKLQIMVKDNTASLYTAPSNVPTWNINTFAYILCTCINFYWYICPRSQKFISKSHSMESIFTNYKRKLMLKKTTLSCRQRTSGFVCGGKDDNEEYTFFCIRYFLIMIFGFLNFIILTALKLKPLG